MEWKTVKLSDNEEIKALIGDGVNSILPFVSMWYIKDEIEYAYVDHEDPENADKYIQEAVDKYHQGYIQCSYCGKWIKISEAHHTAPAGCSCNECFDKAEEDEKDFLSQLD